MSHIETRRLHLGCFDRPVPGWYNTDITPHIFLARLPLAPALAFGLGVISRQRFDQHRSGIYRQVHYLNVSKRFPFEPGSFEFVFCSHMLEHLYPDVALHCLREVQRVLVPGGVFRIVVPDLDLVVSNYEARRPGVLLKKIYENEQARDKNRHHWMYNVHNLAELFERAGYASSRRCAFREGRCPDLEVLDNRAEESLFMEGVK